MARTKTANALVPYQAPRAEGTLSRWAKGLAAGVARAVRPQAALDIRDPVWQSVLQNGGFGGTPFLPSEAGVTVTPDMAMTVATVWGCVSLIAETIAMLPLRLYEREGDYETIAEGHPVDDILFRRPNSVQTPTEWKRLMAASVAMRGNGFSVVNRWRGAVRSVVPLISGRMAVRQLTDITAQYQYTHYEGTYQEFYTGDSEIMHFRGLSTDGVRGLSPIAAARNQLGLALQQENHASKLFTQGAQPMGVLKTQRPMTKEGVQLLRDQFDETFAGVGNSHRTIVLEEGMDWSKVSMNAEETQFLQSRKFSRTEIAMFYRIPPHMIGDVEKSTSWGSGIEQQGIGFLTFTLQPWLTNFCETINRDLLSAAEQTRYFAQFDTSPLTRGDLASRSSALINLKNAGFITANEGRKDLNMNPSKEPGADRLLVSTNTVYLDSPQVREGINRTAQEIATKIPPKDQPAKV
jgi:HK97 family phage portal protein